MSIILKIFRAIKWYANKIYITLFISRTPGLILIGKVKIKGIPIIRIYGGSITIGNNVVLNSDNNHYFINMHSPTKLITSTKNAKIVIGENTRIHGTCIHAYEKITVGKNCLIAANCQIIDTNRHELAFDNPQGRLISSTKTKPVCICDNVWIGANTLILPGVTIGEGSVIAAGSVVTKDVPHFSLNGGNPSKVIKKHYN